ncbi:MAG: glycosyl hydrolase family 5 [Alteromonadaceae bacterium]|nr:MAG: glycosyl hydrolase family 5 [Alteromonadaceae bacterium]
MMCSFQNWASARLVLFTLCLVSCFQLSSCANTPEAVVEKTAESPPHFDIRTGVNISHWLSQSEKRGKARLDYITREDFKRIAALGFDHIRLPMDEIQLNNEDGSMQEEAFVIIHNAIKWAFEFDLKVIIDLHIIRSHHFLDANNLIWTDPKAQQELLVLWQQLSAELAHYPTDKLAYELLNEAVADNHDDWNYVSGMLIADMRKREPSRFIVLGSNRWQGAQTFPMLAIPENDPYIILSFHFYAPNALTHHGAPWTAYAEYQGDVFYPGETVPRNEYANLSPKALTAMKWASGNYDKNRLEQIISPAIRVAKEAGLQLYCGEFGAYPLAPKDAIMRWHSDLNDIFRKYDISRSHWGYRGDFAIFDTDGNVKQDLVDVLIK